MNQNNEILQVASVFSGIGSFEHSLIKNKIKHKILFACDIDNHCKKNYLHNYDLDEKNFYSDIKLINGKKYFQKIDLLVGGAPLKLNFAFRRSYFNAYF